MTDMKDECLRFELLSLDSFAGLDAETVSFQSERLRSLGFEHAADYCMSKPGKSGVRFLTRLSSHPAYNCYSEVYQSFEGARALGEVRCAFISLAGQGWRVFSMGHEPSPLVSLICSRPRRAWASHPGADVFRLFDEHLKLRQRVTTRRGLSVEPLMTLEAFFEEQRRESFAHEELLKKLNEEGVRGRLFGHPKSSWAGDDARTL